MPEIAPKGIDVKVHPPTEEMQRRFRERYNRLRDKSVPYKKAAIFLDRWVQQNFRTEGGKVGGWAPFRLGGRLTKDGIDTSAKLLQDTGRLRASFIPFTTRRNAGIGSDIPYAKKHEEGEGRLPARRMLPKRREVIRDIKQIFNEHVQHVFRDMIKSGRGIAPRGGV